MKIKGLEHVAVAVENLEGIVPVLERILGTPASSPEEVGKDGVRVAKLRLGEDSSQIELVAPSREDSAISRFLERRGGGLHHICLAVENIDGIVRDLKNHGIRMIDEEPRTGADGCRIAFIHPKSVGGLLIELSETLEDDD